VTLGQDKIWQAIDATVTAGLWDTTVFLLSWDDWGGYDDHVATPNLEHTTDGVQLGYGPRVPLLMFGGPVTTGIDSRWNGHTSIGKTVLDLLGLPPLGVPRLDDAPTLADLVDTTAKPSPPPPAHGARRHHHPTDITNTDAHPHTGPTATLTAHHSRRPRHPARRQHPATTQRPTRHLSTPKRSQFVKRRESVPAVVDVASMRVADSMQRNSLRANARLRERRTSRCVLPSAMRLISYCCDSGWQRRLVIAMECRARLCESPHYLVLAQVS